MNVARQPIMQCINEALESARVDFKSDTKEITDKMAEMISLQKQKAQVARERLEMELELAECEFFYRIFCM